MNRYLTIILLTLTACTTQAQAQQSQATPTLDGPSYTATPDVSPTPTQNLQGTIDSKQAELDALNRQRVDATMFSAQETAVQSEFERQMIFASQTAQPTAGTATKSAQKTQAAIVDAQGTQVSIVATTQKEAPTQAVALAYAKQQAQLAPLSVGVSIVAGPALGILGAMILLTLIRYLVQRDKMEREALSNYADETDDELLNTSSRWYMGGGVGVKIPTGVASIEQMADFIKGLARRYPLTLETWARDVDNPRKTFTQRQYRLLINILLDYGIVAWKNPQAHNRGAELTKQGKDWLHDLIAPPPTSSDPKAAPASYPQTDTAPN